MKISVCIITKNEEKNIQRCLESLKWADEIIVVDDFSTDRTVEISRFYTSKVFQNKHQGQMKQKSFAVNKASYDWILNVDADEVIPEALAEEIRQVLSDEKTEYSGFFISRKTFYLGRWIKHGGWYPDWTLRLFHKNRTYWDSMNLHEKVMIKEGKHGYLKQHFLHYYGDISKHLERVNNYSSMWVDLAEQEYKRFSIVRLLILPFGKFFETYIYKAGILDGLAGFGIAWISSFYVFVRELKLWELQKVKNND